MSRDFELLRKAEFREKSTVTPARRETTSEFSPPSQDFLAPAGQTEQAATRESEFAKAFAVIRGRWRLIASFAVLVMAGAAITVFLIRPKYEPLARIEIDPPGSETFTMQTAGAPPSETLYLGTQSQNLQSDDLAIAVIRKLGLERNADFNSKVPVREASADPLQLTSAEDEALRTFRERLKVTHDPNSNVISVGVMAHDPKLAADATNTLVRTFIDRTLKMRHDTITSSRAWLQGQLDDVREKVEQANRDLAAFQKRTGVAEVDEGRNTFGDLMNDLSRQTTQIQSERIQLESFLQKAREGGVDSLPQVRDNPVVQKLTQNLGEVRSQLSQNSVIYGASHPNTKKLQNQVNELEKQLGIQRKAALDQLRMSYGAARAREKMMEAQKKEASKAIGDIAEYNILKKQAQALTALYTSLLGKIEEAGIAAASQSSNIRLVDSARILDQPTHRRRLAYLGVSLFVGIFGGVVLAFMREKLALPLRTPQDIRHWSGIPSVSLIPEFSNDGINGTSQKSHASGRFNEGPEKFLLERPNAPESEAMRALRANLVLAKEEQPQVVLVTSSLPSEGKTTVAVNLALALSQYQKTCLVDADLRRPCVASACGVRSETGLGDVLRGSVPLQNALIAVRDSPNLFVLPGGQASEECAHLIGSRIMQSIMESLRARFQFIVVDSAPIIPYADGRALSTFTDGIIFVTRSGRTPGPAIARSMELLYEVKSPRIIKVVLNAHDAPEQGYYYPYKRS